MGDEMESLMSRTPAQKQAKNCAEQARIVAPSRFVPYILHYRAAYTSVLRFYVACLDAGATVRQAQDHIEEQAEWFTDQFYDGLTPEEAAKEALN